MSFFLPHWLLVFYNAQNQYQNSKQIFLEKELRGHSPNFHIHVSVNNLYIPTINLTIQLQEMEQVHYS
jgi:hypothetical protein